MRVSSKRLGAPVIFVLLQREMKLMELNVRKIVETFDVVFVISVFIRVFFSFKIRKESFFYVCI